MILIERDAAAVQGAADRVRATYDRLASSGRLTTEEAQKRIMRIVCTPDYAALELIDVVSKEKGIARHAFTPEQIQERVLGAIVNEAALVLQDGIAQRPGDVDLVLVNGYGFPSNRGDPLFWASHRPRADLNRMIDDVAGDIGFGFRRADLDKALAGI